MSGFRFTIFAIFARLTEVTLRRVRLCCIILPFYLSYGPVGANILPFLSFRDPTSSPILPLFHFCAPTAFGILPFLPIIRPRWG